MQRQLLQKIRSQLSSELRRNHRRKNRSPWLISGLFIAIITVSYFLHEPQIPPSTLAKGTEINCTVKSVQDGDTLTANCPSGQVKVRVFGIDTPEMGQKPWGEQAKRALLELLPHTGEIRLQVHDQDRYQRIVAQVWVDQRDLGLELVRRGQASVYKRYNDSPLYLKAQSAAQQAKRGIWQQPGNQQDPAAWRRLNPQH